MSKIEEKVETLIKKPINDIGYELYDIEYVKEGKDYFLRIYIDNKEGISIEDCEKVNYAISDLLDNADYIKDQYYLEVSSPGIERVLRKDKHLEQNINNDISIKLFKKDEHGQKEYVGMLKNFDKETITIKVEDSEYIIKRKDIANIKTIFNW